MSRFALLGCLLALLAGLAIVVSADGKEPEPLTKEERARLETEATKLNDDGIELYRDGRYAEAVHRLEQALAVRERLYPKQDFPAGHLDLAASLNNLGIALQSLGRYDRAVA